MKTKQPIGRVKAVLVSLLALFISAGAADRPSAPKNSAGFIRVRPDGKGFVIGATGQRFTPWGFNYDHDRSNRLLETYWEKDQEIVAQDFAEMKALGANTVRIHLQVSRFMNSPGEANQRSLQQLAQLIQVADTNGLFLMVTGLGSYDKADVPAWYNDLDEGPRWTVQARFWEAVAKTCRQSRAVFCYDLMNEPVLTEDKKTRDWTPGAFGDRYFVQRLTLDLAGRTQQQVAKAWVDKMVSAIHQHDAEHLITVGVIPWAMVWPQAKPIFYSAAVSEKLDFVSVHFYPKSGEVDKALTALAVYDIGKPIVIEEMFPLHCSVQELNKFIEGSRTRAAGWIGFYWGKTMAEYERESRSIGDELTLNWLKYFSGKAPELASPAISPKARANPK